MQACTLEWDFNESHWVIQSFQIIVAEKIFMSSFVCNGGHSQYRIWKFNGSHTYPYHYTTRPIIMQPTFPSVPRGWFLLLLAHLPVSLSQLRAQWWGRERAAAILLILGTGWNYERAPGGHEHWGEVFEVSKGNRPRRDTCWKVISMIWILNTFNHKNAIKLLQKQGVIITLA